MGVKGWGFLTDDQIRNKEYETRDGSGAESYGSSGKVYYGYEGSVHVINMLCYMMYNVNIIDEQNLKSVDPTPSPPSKSQKLP